MESVSEPAPLFLDLREASTLLRVKPATLYEWVHFRKIPFRKHGRRLAFSRAELEAWSKSRSTPELTREVQMINSDHHQPKPQLQRSLKISRTADRQ